MIVSFMQRTFHQAGRRQFPVGQLCLTKGRQYRWEHATTNLRRRLSIHSISLEEEIQHANERQDKILIQKTGDDRGYGVFAAKDMDIGEIVISATALETSSEQGSHTIQTGWNSHVYMDLPARFLNHVCGQATVGIRPNDTVYDFVAIVPISQGDEVVWDYECSEYELDNFECACGVPSCRGHLRGFRYNGPIILEAYGKENVAPYLFTPPDMVCRSPIMSHWK